MQTHSAITQQYLSHDQLKRSNALMTIKYLPSKHNAMWYFEGFFAAVLLGTTLQEGIPFKFYEHLVHMILSKKSI